MQTNDSHRDVVFAPCQVVSPTFGAVFQQFKSRQRQMKLTNWTCKKTAREGDLYIFYFGEPQSAICGVAVCSTRPDQIGWKKRHWTNRQKTFFCDFDNLHLLTEQITARDIASSPALRTWWNTRPYRGRPKSIPRGTVTALLRTLIKNNTKLRNFVTDYIVETEPYRELGDIKARPGALEGTVREMIARTPSRSHALREDKIRDTLRECAGRLVCEVPGCGFDFLETYGEVGRGYAHVHHLKPLARRRQRRTRLSDLAIVCANCHAMIHRRGQCRKLDELIVTSERAGQVV